MDPNQPQSFAPQHDGNQSFGYPQMPPRNQNPEQPAHHREHHQEHHHAEHNAAPHVPQPHHEVFPSPFTLPSADPMPQASSFTSPVTPMPTPTPPTPTFAMPTPSTPPSAPLDAPAPATNSPFGTATQSQPIVKVLSPFGVEYVFLALTLFFAASGLIAALLILVNGSASFSALSFPVATLLVTVPVFSFLFLRLKKLEMRMPHLRLDASKRRTTQFIQIISFIATISSVIGFVYSVFAKMAGQSGTSVGKAFLDALCFVVVAGGILAYYWREEHASRR
ncbi:MAG TPA: hypothetical protein VIM53_03460 [Candidatus Saccharimonadales bacterium]